MPCPAGTGRWQKALGSEAGWVQQEQPMRCAGEAGMCGAVTGWDKPCFLPFLQMTTRHGTALGQPRAVLVLLQLWCQGKCLVPAMLVSAPAKGFVCGAGDTGPSDHAWLSSTGRPKSSQRAPGWETYHPSNSEWHE